MSATFIVIEGVIGVGKSTLTQSLADSLGYRAFHEPVKSNPYLERYYEDTGRWAFEMQMFLLSERFHQHQEAIWTVGRPGTDGIVQDRSIYGDVVFAHLQHEMGFMDDLAYSTYLRHFNLMKRFLLYPDVMVYLRVDPEVAAERIASRARDAEQTIPTEYLIRLHNRYEEFIDEIGQWIPVMTIDWTEFRPTDEVLAEMQCFIKGKTKFIRGLTRI